MQKLLKSGSFFFNYIFLFTIVPNFINLLVL